MGNANSEWKPIWWTTIIVTLSMTIFGGITRLVERKLNEEAYINLQTFFRASQPDYFPLAYLLVSFVVVFAIVLAYRLALPRMPASWIIRGVIVGAFLFLVADLPVAFTSVYTTVLTSAAIQGMAISALVNKFVNGLILAYAYKRFSHTEIASKPIASR
jgi:hypothetical protein